ncbi:FliI/YscN family ATPase [Cupriavidus basilensis]|uniref:FliI/YscN family ATPase n=1 Tax=Cupriavidus basilensis TaxID=68895 RepID=A0ABT6AW21_9BURK|nr:FliI/YscN family ATPase [Cupriavidus basilensis]MDF3836826.1 FliI/YscN family ATPase [Cupriavidus basilensis]
MTPAPMPSTCRCDAPDSQAILARIQALDLRAYEGRVTRVMPTFLEADGPGLPVGSLCEIQLASGSVIAEIAGVDMGRVTLVPYTGIGGVHVGARVAAVSQGADMAVGPEMLGRVIDALGRAIDGGPAMAPSEHRPLHGTVGNPLARARADKPIETGVRAIDTLLTLAVGQRVGIFAGSGVGKSTLLSTIAANTEADCCVLCLVGERGREAQEFWQHNLSAEDRARSVMVVATSDQSAVMRARSVLAALTVAEYLRDTGGRVLFMLDSVTRYAMALREIGLAAGEPPTARAYTPGVFAALPRVVERCGAFQDGGAITAIMTVLTESDNADDPLADTMRALLDGHIVLSRKLAEQGHYPAIDVSRSMSRLFRHVVAPDEGAAAADATRLLSIYNESRVLVEAGLYKAGENPELDRAIRLRDSLNAFLRQSPDVRTGRTEAVVQLKYLLEGHRS